jgi:hypothetical protein
MITRLRRLIASLIPTSLEGRAAATAALLLLVIVTVAIAYYAIRGTLPDFLEHRAVPMFILTVALPIILYVGVRYWSRVEESEFPDINEAWQAGIAALQNAGMTIDSAPLFLILGSTVLEDVFADAMRTGQVAFRVERVPAVAGVAPALRWYANEKAIYLFCPGVGALGSLARLLPGGAMGGRDPTIAPWSIGSAPARPQRSAALQAAYGATIGPGDFHMEGGSPDDSSRRYTPAQRNAPPMSTEIAPDQVRRLRYLCRLIKHARRPRCGINGAVTLLPYELVTASKPELQSLIDAIQGDIHAIQQTLLVLFPVSGLVVGMQQAKGFNEFVISLGVEDIHRRLGSRFDVRMRPTVERLQRLSDGICDAFETFIYAIFAQQDVLWQSDNNRRLYSLMCRVRQELKPNLNVVLKAFSDPTAHRVGSSAGQVDRLPIFFSGCYLAATGAGADQQAFIKEVLDDKLVREQARVEWTAKARRTQQLFQLAVWAGWIVFALVSALLIWEIASQMSQ